MKSPTCTRPFFIKSLGILKSLLPSPNWTRRGRCDNLSLRSSSPASDTEGQTIMDDKIFASARMTATLDDDQTAYEAIPSVNIFDRDLDLSRPTNAILQSVSRPRRRVGRWLILMPLLTAACFLLLSCQGGGY